MAGTNASNVSGMVEMGRRHFMDESDVRSSVPDAKLARTDNRVRLDIVEHMAGPIAEEFARRSSVVAVWLQLRDWTDRIPDQDPALPQPNLGEDAGKVRQAMQGLSPSDPHQALKALGDVAISLVCAEWPGIRCVAEALRAAGSMEGDVFEAAWRQVRPGPDTRTRRLARASLRALGDFLPALASVF